MIEFHVLKDGKEIFQSSTELWQQHILEILEKEDIEDVLIRYRKD